MGQTLLSEKLKEAGLDTNATLLHAMAVAELQKTSIMIAGKPSRIRSEAVAQALGPFTAEVRDAGGVLASLVPYSTTRDLAWEYLEIVARDMRGPEKTGSGGAHLRRDGRPPKPPARDYFFSSPAHFSMLMRRAPRNAVFGP